jgi:hypothetical protein
MFNSNPSIPIGAKVEIKPKVDPYPTHYFVQHLSTFQHLHMSQIRLPTGVGVNRQACRQAGREGCETWHLMSRGYNNYMVLCTLTSSPYKAKNSNVGCSANHK